jgi:hypothetical protein
VPRAWYLVPDDEDVICQGCFHSSVDHVFVVGSEGDAVYPCMAEERFDVGADGRMTLVKESCTCRGFEK